MAKKHSIPVPADPAAQDRRRFLEGMAFSAGAVALLSGIGASRSARAQFVPPPAPTAPQPPPLKEVAGKTAYITAASDGIGLGIARACSNAGMKVVIGYRNEKRLAQALPLFKPDNAGIHPIKHDVTDRDGWVRLLEEIKGKVGNLRISGREPMISTRSAPGSKPALTDSELGRTPGLFFFAVRQPDTDRSAGRCRLFPQTRRARVRTANT